MIWNFCIKRPVFTVVIFLVVAIFGFYGYSQMPVRENPDIDFPIVSVSVVLPGAEPEVVETEIVDRLEEEINTVEGLKTLTSTSREQVGTIVAEFELWRDIDIAAQDVRDRVNRALRDLPQGIEAPIVSKLDPDAFAIMWIALYGDERWDNVRLTRYADEVLKERLEGMRGVGQILIGGEHRYAVRVELDPERLVAHDLTVQEVTAAIRRENVDIPTGRVEGEKREFLVKVQGQFGGAAPINDIVVAYRDGAPVRVADLGLARDGVENDRQVARFKGRKSVGLGVVKQSDANTVALAERVRGRMQTLSKDFPPGLEYTVAADSSVYIEESIRDLLFTIFIASALVVLVVVGFLRNWWGTLITSLAIPSSLLGGLAVMNILGFSINTLTTLALILAIGIVIDDAIVILESTYRHVEKGVESVPAARIGTTEVAFAAIANTLSLSAVFIPVAFTPGLVGRFFYEFGLTVVVTVFASTFTALTLTPMLSARVLAPSTHRGRFFQSSEKLVQGFENAYARLLKRAFGHKLLTVVIGLLALGLGMFFFTRLSREFTPSVDRSEFIISFETPEGATLSITDAYARAIEAVLAQTPEVKHQFLAIGLSRGGAPGKVNEGISFVRLIPRDQRQKHQSQVVQELRTRLSKIPLGRAYLIEETAGVGRSESPFQLVLQHPNLETLAREQEPVMGWLADEMGLLGIRSDLKLNKPQLLVRINRDRSATLGVSVTDISNTMRFLLGEPKISEIERENERYEIIPEILGKGDLQPDMLRRLYVRAAAGALVPLADLIEMEERAGPSEIPHFNRIRSATLSGATPPGATLGDVMEKVRLELERRLPAGFEYVFSGESQDLMESFYYLTITIIFSVVLVYLILAAQFESFYHPFTILLTLPLASVGAFGALWALGMPFGIVAFIGVIMLVGMATKNAILMIDYTNVLVARGRDPEEAAMEAARVRFRPVVMTTVSTVLGISPIALGYGAGGEARAPMGVAVGSGLLATTALTLLIIPVVYALFDKARRRIFMRVGGDKEV